MLSFLIAVCFSLDIADDFVRDARRAYALPEYAAYTNSLVGTGRYAGRRLGRALEERRPWREGSVKWYDAPKAINVRDIGGWNGLRTGLVFRGGEFDRNGRDLTDEGRRVFREEMRIRTDLDLRGPRKETALGGDVRLVVAQSGAYDGVIDSEACRKTLAAALRVFADVGNFPVYVHCAGGADRTGTVLFFLEGLCGVSEVDLSIDYELTSFGSEGAYRQRFDHDYRFASLVRRLAAYPGATLADRIAVCARRELGLTDAEIAEIRRNLVAPLDCSNDIVLGEGAERIVLGLDGRLKPSDKPFVSVRLKDGRLIPCNKVSDDGKGDLYFEFPEKSVRLVFGTESGPKGLTFPIRAITPKNAEVVVSAGCVSAPGAATCEGRTVTAMTYNVRVGLGDERQGWYTYPLGYLGYLPQCARVIREANPDWVAVEEIDNGTERTGKVDQTAALAKLTGMKGVFRGKIPYQGGEYGVALLLREEPVSVRKIELGGPPTDHMRILVAAELKDMIVCATHFSLDQARRLEAVAKIRAAFAESAKPVFIGGDFNMTPSSPEFGKMCESFTPISGTDFATWPSHEPKEHIDFVFVDTAHADRVTVEKVVSPETDLFATDHRPVVVRFRMRTKCE